MVDHTSEFRLNPDGPSPEDDAFARTVARSLRAPESAAPDFDARLMAAVRVEAPHRAAVKAAVVDRRTRSKAIRPWLTRERQLRASPLTLGALAAGFAAVVSVTTLVAVRSPGGDPERLTAAAAAVPDTVHLVRFVFVAPDARTVSLVGDFNGWAAGATPLDAANGAGSWTATVPLPTGRHEYAFVVEDSGDGRRWSPDPLAPAVRDEHDTQTSVILVGGDAARRL